MALKQREPGYQPYGIQSFQEVRKRDATLRLGGLGPPLTSDNWKHMVCFLFDCVLMVKHDRKEREMHYAETVRERLYRRHMGPDDLPQ
jgi:hypothetical protein